MKIKDGFKFGLGFYLGYTLMKCTDLALGRMFEPVIRKFCDKIKS